MKREPCYGFLVFPRGLFHYADRLVNFRESPYCDFGHMAFYINIRARNVDSAKRKARSICDCLCRNTSQQYDFACASAGAAEKLLNEHTKGVTVDLNDDNIMSFSDVPF